MSANPAIIETQNANLLPAWRKDNASLAGYSADAKDTTAATKGDATGDLSIGAKPNFEVAEDDKKIIKIDEKLDGIYSVVGVDDVISGNMSCKRGIRVSGTVKGNVEAKNGSVIVDAGAIIEGNVVASGRIICLGTIGRNDETKSDTITVACPGIVVTAGEGKIYGDVYYGKLLTSGDADTSFIDGLVRPYAKFAKDKSGAGK